MSDPNGLLGAPPPPPTPGGWYQASDGQWYPTHAPPAGAYGAPYGYQYPAHYAQPGSATGTNGLAIASLVCSCVGAFLFGVPAVLGVIFGFVARSQIRRSGGAQAGDGMALAGIIVGFAVIGLYTVVLILALASSSVTPNCC